MRALLVGHDRHGGDSNLGPPDLSVCELVLSQLSVERDIPPAGDEKYSEVSELTQPPG